jgi:lysozyme
MKTSPNGRKLIEEFEGCILQAYDDHNDKIAESGVKVIGTLTIGYGHTSAAGSPLVFVGQTITKDEADAILSTDLEKVEREVNDLVKASIDQNQFDALVSFHFNTGALGKSTLLRLLNEGNYAGAADQFTVWDHVGGTVIPGLLRRRMAERSLFLLTTITPPLPTKPSPEPSLGFWDWFKSLFSKGTN